MASFARELDVPYLPRQMYDLVDDIEKYPEYLPWCAGASVERREGNELLATLDLRKGPLRHSFSTVNIHDPEALAIDVHLARGPLSSLQGKWLFEALGEDRCRVKFEISYAFANAMLDTLLGPLFELVYSRMVESFAERARSQYG